MNSEEELKKEIESLKNEINLIKKILSDNRLFTREEKMKREKDSNDAIARAYEYERNYRY